MLLISMLTLDVCQCPDSVRSSMVLTGVNNSESITVVSVCSGKPCEYSFESKLAYQVIICIN